MSDNSSPRPDARLVDPWTFLEFAEIADLSGERALAVYLINSMYAAFDAMEAAAEATEASHRDGMPVAAASPPESKQTPPA